MRRQDLFSGIERFTCAQQDPFSGRADRYKLLCFARSLCISSAYSVCVRCLLRSHSAQLCCAARSIPLHTQFASPQMHAEVFHDSPVASTRHPAASGPEVLAFQQVNHWVTLEPVHRHSQCDGPDHHLSEDTERFIEGNSSGISIA